MIKELGFKKMNLTRYQQRNNSELVWILLLLRSGPGVEVCHNLELKNFFFQISQLKVTLYDYSINK